MDEETKGMIDLAIYGAGQQLELSRRSMENQLDATDRFIANEAARAVIAGAPEAMRADPTTPPT